MKNSEPLPVVVPIPDVFKHSITLDFFDCCALCNKSFKADSDEYMIEKVLKKDPVKIKVIAEYAICIPCAEKSRMSLSEDSRKQVEEYFQKNVDFEKRKARLLSQPVPDVNTWISDCLIKRSPVDEASEYQLMAHCKGKQLVLNYAPFMISSDVLRDLWELLSAETQESLENYDNVINGLPPELKLLLSDLQLQASHF
jgi:hypothetical protein